LVGLCAALTILPAQQPGRPRFDRYHLLPFRAPYSAKPRPFTRGQLASVYGYDLLPVPWCAEPHNQSAPYPLELCGVRVLMGGHPAGLMYAGPMGNKYMTADQINFQVPDDAPSAGIAPVQVCRGAICSEPLDAEFTDQDIILGPPVEAFLRMPIWIDVEVPMNPDFRYPIRGCPWDFGDYEFEVRRDGQPLPRVALPRCAPRPPHAFLGVPGTPRLPLHLFHRFDAPGTYKIRLIGPILTPDLTQVARQGSSAWISITVQPHSKSAREEWLHTIAPGADRLRGDSGQILDLLAWPDDAALAALLPFLPAPPPRAFSGPPNLGVECFAPAALHLFPEPLLRKSIPLQRLAQLLTPQPICQ